MSKRDIESIYELSPQQKGMLFDSLHSSGSGIHIEQKVYRLNGELDVVAMGRSWQRLVDRHAILRTAFVWKNQAQPLQVVLRRVSLPLLTHDWRDLLETERQEKLSLYLDIDRRRGFELSKAPLMRLNLFRLGERDYQLAWTHHHIILDGWCRPIIDRELRLLYDAFSRGEDLHLPTSRPYRDYISWLKQRDLSQAEAFWRQSLKGITRPTPLGVETEDGDVVDNTQAFGDHIARFPAGASGALKSLARQNHLTVNTIIQGIWALLLSRYCGQNDVVFGTTVSGRPADLESAGSMIGLFINTLPFRVKIAESKLLPWLSKLQEQHLEIRHYEYCSTGQIHQWTEVPGAQPLYESIIVFENYPTYPPSTSGVTFNTDEAYTIGAQTRYPLNILIIDRSELELYIAYDRRRFDSTAITRLVEHMSTLLKAIIVNPGQDLRILAQRIPSEQAPKVRSLVEIQKGREERHWIAPRNATEKALASIWGEVLGIDGLSIDDNFFELHGHSLLATQVFARIRQAFDVKLPLRCLFESPTIAGLAERIEAAGKEKAASDPPILLPVPRNAPLPLSFAQQRLWFLNQLQPDSPFYNVALPLRISGPLNLNALEKALNQIVDRHEALRTVFIARNDEPVQKILASQELKLAVIDLGDLPEEDREREALKLLVTEAEQIFDLSQGPLFRATLLRLTDSDQFLSLNTHHIVSDGWSMAILFRELAALYASCTSPRPALLPKLQIQYADYAVWQRNWLQGDVLESQLSYWRRQLAGAPLVLELPLDTPRPPVQSFRGAKLKLTLPPELSRSLKSLSQREGVTLFMTLIAAFELLLSKYTATEDIMVGTDLANRSRVETEELIGFFVNLLPIRTKLSGNPSFCEFLKRVKDVVLDAYAHQDVPFEKIVEELQPARDLRRNPLVQVLFVMQNTPARVLELSGVKLSQIDLKRDNSRFDLVLFMAEGTAGLDALWVYNPDLFNRATIASMAGRFETLLKSIEAEPGARISNLEMLGSDERKKKAKAETEHQQSRLSELRGSRRKVVDVAQLSAVSAGYVIAGESLPLVLEPRNKEIDLAEWASKNLEFLDRKLLQHGAILFRGFDVASVAEFEKFAATVCRELFGEYGDLPREELGGKVYGSTPYPADETILFHNESSHMHRWPMLIWFYCVKSATEGGESPILDCRKVYQLMDPAIRQKFERKGLMYVRNFTEDLDVNWQSFFHTSDRNDVEEYCRNAGIKFEWKGANRLRTTQICPAVVKHPQTGELVFFNQLQLHHISCLTPAVRDSLLSMMKEEDLPRNVYYGDGSRIADSVMQYLGELYRQQAVKFRWTEHDVLMLNNMLVAHSRNPYVGERKIVVALGDLVSKEQFKPTLD